MKHLVLLLAVCLLSTSCNGLEPSNPQPVSITEYTILTNDRGVIALLLVDQWEGKDNFVKEFDSSGPLIVEYRATSESSISSDFKLQVGKEIADGVFYTQGGSTSYTSTVGKGTRYLIVKDSGHFRLTIKSHGCRWWVRIGREKG